MNEHLIAIDTYGSHRVKDPHTGQMVSAYKIGYSSAASAVLLALYGDRARDVSSKHASYHYIQVEAEATVRHGYLLLKVSDDELTRAEAITIQSHRPAVYRWLDGVWQEFPHLRQPEYTPLVGRSGPNFNPTGLRIVAASTGEAEAAVAGITVEKSQRSERDTPWWWLRGDTYPQRETLKRWGCRWSQRQKAWYYIGNALPEVVQRLVDEQTPPDDDPCSVAEAAAILGVPVKDEVPAAEPPRLYALGETVYARHDLETPDGQPIPTGAQGAITWLYNRNPTHSWSYDVDFAGIGEGWYFERELTPLAPLPGIRVTHGRVAPPGVELASDSVINQALVESGHQPEAVATLPPDEPDGAPSIRIIKPVLSDTDSDPITTAVRQTRPENVPVLQPTTSTNGKRGLARIPQAACGELTGSITGNVWCYGWATHEGVCVYLNMGGPRMAVEAIRAKLAKGDIVTCVPWDAPGIELTAGEGNTGMYAAFLQNIPEAKFTSLILCHELLTQPNYGGQSTTFIFHVSDEQAMAQLRQHVTKLVKVPVFPEWTGYLWQAGQAAMLLRPTRTGGDVKLWTLTLDADAWTRLITGGLSENVIKLTR
ncbi:MAG: hypothetical protein K8I60_06630 [Anaerolineae bacterium]|nr:hypothetical protein [Anaerolineae bacterium]